MTPARCLRGASVMGKDSHKAVRLDIPMRPVKCVR